MRNPGQRGRPPTFICFLALMVLLFSPMGTVALARQCVTIQSGQLYDSSGEKIEMGFDNWGYNYQAHMFNGKYCQAYHNASWCQPYADIDLEMTWNDAWLSNKDCDGDGKLDTHYGYESYRGSGAWLTISQKGFFVDKKGARQQWSSLERIVAVPRDAILREGRWYTSDGTEIGPSIWDNFAVTMRYVQSTGVKVQGILYLSPFAGKAPVRSRIPEKDL